VVREGIIDAVGGLSDGLACLYRMIGEAKGRAEQVGGKDSPKDAAGEQQEEGAR